MKRKALYIFFMFSCNFFTLKAQNVEVLDSVNNIALYNNSYVKAIYIKDTHRGGNFFLYNGADIADNGMIFKDALNRKWRRQTFDEKINIQWYGARAASSIKDTLNDLYPKLLAALQYVWNHDNFTTVYIPSDYTGINAYLCLYTVNINRPVNIIGDGVNTLPLTWIWFPPNKKGFTTTFLTPEKSRNAVKFNNLGLDGRTTPGTGFDSSAHMISPKGFTEVSNCVIINTGGNGIHLEACTQLNSPIYGNVDGSVIEDVEFAFCNNGIYLNGCDANIVKMRRNFYTNMRRWGQYNNGFLGSQESEAHYSVNGYNNNCFVRYNGKTYNAINTDYFINIGKRPDLEPSFWEEFYYNDLSFNEWSPTKKYWSGGPYFASNDNGYSKYDYNYTEGNQAPARTNGKALVIGGDNGSGVKGGTFIEAANSQLFIRNVGMVLRDGDLSIGQIAANANLRINQLKANKPAIWLSSDSLGGVQTWYQNNSSPTLGWINYDTKHFDIGTQNKSRIIIDSVGLKPNTSDLYNLGSSTKYWKNVYATKYYGDASTMTGIPVSYWTDKGSGNISNNNVNNIGINQTSPTAQLHIVGSNTSKLGLLITGGSKEGWNTSSGQIQLGHSADHLMIGYEGSNGYTYFDNSYNNSNAKQFFRLRTNGNSVTPLTLTGANAVGINNTSPNESAILDVSSTSKGLLPPRMTTLQKNSIITPAEGLIVYDLTLHKLCVFNGTKWETITSQ